MTRLFEGFYRRTGWRYVGFVFALTVVLGAGLFIIGCALMLIGYLDRPDVFPETVRRVLVCTVVGYGFAFAVTWRHLRPAIQKVRDPESGVDADAAWRSAVLAPVRICLAVFVGATAIGVPYLFPYIVDALDLDPLQTATLLVAGLAALLTCGVVALFAAELSLRPVVSGLAQDLPPGWRPPPSLWSVRAKVAGLFLAVAMAAGFGVGSLIPDTATPIDVVTWTTLIGTGFAAFLIFPVAFLLLNAFLEPLRDLRKATDRVARGDFSQAVPQITADEFGDVVTGFNHLQERVREQLDEMQASRARIVSASDAERRRVERNLHDGAQQRLVALALRLAMIENGADSERQRAQLVEARTELEAALSELRELARGLHPQVLSTGGLGPALRQLAERAPIPVAVSAPDERFSEHVESTAFFVASEALANVAKYAQASRAQVRAERGNGLLSIEVSDDGVGGADVSAGSGLTGLADRVAALSGRLTVQSPPGAGTRVVVELPVGDGRG